MFSEQVAVTWQGGGGSGDDTRGQAPALQGQLDFNSGSPEQRIQFPSLFTISSLISRITHPHIQWQNRFWIQDCLLWEGASNPRLIHTLPQTITVDLHVSDQQPAWVASPWERWSPSRSYLMAPLQSKLATHCPSPGGYSLSAGGDGDGEAQKKGGRRIYFETFKPLP